MTRAYFGTDGVRGPYGGPLINEDFVARLGCAAAIWASAAGAGDGRVLIGRDTRASGEALERAVAAGLRAGGLRPFSLGVLPTPAVARAMAEQGARLGVVVTASHNPAADNGIKFFDTGGRKLDDAQEAAIEAVLPASGFLSAAAKGEPVAAAGGDAAGRYVETLAALVPAGGLAGWRIVADTANGATAATTPRA
nr:phosphoglucosamine mutase [Opitutaceae bacterium]